MPTMSWSRATVVAMTAAAAGALAAVAGALWWLSRGRKAAKLIEIGRVVVLENETKCNKVIKEFLGMERPVVMGFDCEWANLPRRNKGSKEAPAEDESMMEKVDLVQLATLDRALLVRLCKMKGRFPKTLEEILEDKSVIKLGVAVCDDATRLRKDYGVNMRGCLDLRHMAVRCKYGWGSESVLDRAKGLKSLASTVLDVAMDKSFRVRCSNWRAQALTDQQVLYAANDAYVAVLIFEKLISWNKLIAGDEKSWKDDLRAYQTVVDLPFRLKAKNQNKARKRKPRPAVQNPASSSFLPFRWSLKQSNKEMTRKSLLYHNCRLESPDGTLLCTCDKKKVNWYLDRKLADIVTQEPLTVRLKFEPSGKPDESKRYYLTEKSNVCVVCGREDSYICKNVIPREYRKHFPDDLKQHLSHDVLLLCPDCHHQSEYHDGVLRQKLSVDYSAPMSGSSEAKRRRDPQLSKVKSAAKALLQQRNRLPVGRRTELESIIKNHFGVEEISESLLKESASIDVNSELDDGNYIPHGKIIVDAVKAQGKLRDFEKMWRQHFLDTMHPKHLPSLWSVTHNQE